MSEETKNKEDPKEWINEFYDIFPKGTKNLNGYIRIDKGGCLKKMIDFCKENPEFNKAIIITATKNYIQRFKKSV